MSDAIHFDDFWWFHREYKQLDAEIAPKKNPNEYSENVNVYIVEHIRTILEWFIHFQNIHKMLVDQTNVMNCISS